VIDLATRQGRDRRTTSVGAGGGARRLGRSILRDEPKEPRKMPSSCYDDAPGAYVSRRSSDQAVDALRRATSVVRRPDGCQPRHLRGDFGSRPGTDLP
jgi:hypothetical protein